MPELGTIFNGYQVMFICLLAFITILIAIMPILSALINNLNKNHLFSRLSGLLITILVGFLFVEVDFWIKIIAVIIVVYVIIKEAKNLCNYWYSIGETIVNVGINLLVATAFVSIFTKDFNDSLIIIGLFLSVILMIIGETVCSKTLPKN
jgi:hypothetical protein